MVATAEQIVGAFLATTTVSLEPGASPEEIREKMRAAVGAVDQGEGVIIMADLFGGTPCKESLMLCKSHNLEVLAGVNLPMLLKANSLRKEAMPLSDLAHALTQYAQRNITCASDLVREATAQAQ
jgi:PTS system mannose-specific IIA component